MLEIPLKAPVDKLWINRGDLMHFKICHLLTIVLHQ